MAIEIVEVAVQGPPGVGATGADGADGISAYEVAVEEGFVGTEAEWLESLIGADGADSTVPGPQGDQGDPGPGLPAGGTDRQIIAKVGSTDYETEWIVAPYAPEVTPVGVTLPTTGVINLDLVALNGTYQSITLTGDVTFTTSNLAEGLQTTLFVAAGGSIRTISYPSQWVPFGAELPTTLESGKELALAVLSKDSTDLDVRVVAAVQL